MSHNFSQEQISFIKQLMTQRNKSVRHEVSDHLDNALPVKKLQTDATAGSLLIDSGSGPIWLPPAHGSGYGLTSDISSPGGAKWVRGGLGGVVKILGDITVGSTAYASDERYPLGSGSFTFDGGAYRSHTFMHRGFANSGFILLVMAGGSVSGSGASARHAGGTVVGYIASDGVSVPGGGVSMSSAMDVPILGGTQTIYFCASAWGAGTKSPTAWSFGDLATIEFWRV